MPATKDQSSRPASPVPAVIGAKNAEKHACPGGLARNPAFRGKPYTPKEFAAALEEHGIERTERWVAEQCAAGVIHTLPAFGRHLIPESELFRLAGVEEAT